MDLFQFVWENKIRFPIGATIGILYCVSGLCDIDWLVSAFIVDPDPHWFGSSGSRSGSRSKEIDQNLQINMISSL